MRIYLLRHGIAEEKLFGMRDEERRLTPEGKEKLRRVLEAARRAGFGADAIWTSPLVRAVESARIAAEVMGCGKILECEELVPDGEVEAVWRKLQGSPEDASLMLVGHEPMLSQLGSFLLGSKRTVMEMKKGALACLEVHPEGEEPRSVLLWLITARLAGAVLSAD